MTKNHPIQCRCGKLQAEVIRPESGTRAVCYCRACQAFAHYLGSPGSVLDAHGGTDIIAISPRNVSFTSGFEHLACMSLTAHGTLRWYADCCRTPIGNTPRDFRTSHVGLIHNCLEHSGIGIDASFGPVKMRVNRKGAKGQPLPNSIITFPAAMVLYLGSLKWSRISGKYRKNPFFDGNTGKPRKEPKVLAAAERERIMSAV